MPSKNSIDDNDNPSKVAATTHSPPSTGERRRTRSQGYPPDPVDLGAQDMARPHTPHPPPAPNESADLSVDDSVDEGSPPLLSNPEDANFSVVQTRGRQRVTPLQLAIPTQAVCSPTPTGNSFSALADTDAPDDPGTGATNSDDAIYKAVIANDLAVGMVLQRQDQKLDRQDQKLDAFLMAINSLITKLDDRIDKVEERHAESMATLTRHAESMATLTQLGERHADSMAKMEDRLLAKIGTFHEQFGDIRMDVNNHEQRLVALKSIVTNHGSRLNALTSDLLLQESVLKGYKDTNDTTVATLRADINDTRARFPDLRRELQELNAGLT